MPASDRRKTRLFLTVSAALLALISSRDGTAAGAPETEIVHYDFLDANGNLDGGRVELAVPMEQARVVVDGTTFVTLLDGGPPENRIDWVFVGDGYTTVDLGTYALHVDVASGRLFEMEPFASYVDYFNVHRVDVISNESGVDEGDGTDPDTALDMRFDGRLLLVNTGAAIAYAGVAPDWDHVFAVGNTTTYGGAGYTSVATLAGGNAAAGDLALHEMGHGFGGLADEYDYGNSGPYVGSEPGEPNVSIRTEAEMLAQGSKWAAWLGADDPFEGATIGTYEGARYHTSGIYRPTPNSMMRNLYRPFNAPSVEALLLAIYRDVRPIDTHTANTNAVYATGILSIEVLQPVTHALAVQWFVDGEALADETSTSLDLAALGLSEGTHTVDVRVVDPTPWMRDEDARDQFMTQTVTWTVEADAVVTSAPANDPRGALAVHVAPNPFNPATTIRFVPTAGEPTSLRVLDVAGRVVRTLERGRVLEPEQRTWRWNGTDDAGHAVASGVYFAVIESGARSARHKMVLVK